MSEEGEWIATTRGGPPFKYDPDLKDRYEAMVTLHLPIYIPLPDDIYPVIVDERVAHIRLERFETKNEIKERIFELLEREHDFSRDVPLSAPLLRSDPFNQSQAIVMFKPTVEELKKFEGSEKEKIDPYTKATIDSLLDTSLKFVNRLLESYQHVTGLCAIGFLRPWDVGQYEGGIVPISKENPQQGVTISHIGFARNIWGSKKPFLSDTQVDRISKIARLKEFPNHFRLLISARFLYLMGDYSAAIITAQSALEIYLQGLLVGRGVSHIRIRTRSGERLWPLRNLGLKRLYNEGMVELVGKSISEHDEQLGIALDKARQIRNKIIHEGHNASIEEGNDCLQAFAKAIFEIVDLTN